MRKSGKSQPQVNLIAQLLTIDQVAALLSVHRCTVYGLIRNHGLPVMKLGTRSTRVNSVKLQRWMDQQSEGMVS